MGKVAAPAQVLGWEQGRGGDGGAPDAEYGSIGIADGHLTARVGDHPFIGAPYSFFLLSTTI